MSLYDYDRSYAIQDEPFAALIMAAMRRADSINIVKLRVAFPDIYDELNSRYNSPGGILVSERT